MADQQFPFTMFCPGCKVGIKIKKPDMIGRRIDCPKCSKRITVVTPDEDGTIPYGITPAPEPEPEHELTEEELAEIENQQRKERNQRRMRTAKHIGSILFYLGLLVGIGLVWYNFIYLTGLEREEKAKKEPGGRRGELIRPASEFMPRRPSLPV